MGLYDSLQEGVEAPAKAVSRVPWLPVIAGAAVLVAFFFVWTNYLNTPIAVSLEKGVVKKGESATLTVIYKNTTSNDLENVTVSIQAVDTTQFTFDSTTFSFDKIAAGQERKKEVKVTASSAMDEGTYAIEVTAKADGFEVKQRASLRVE